MGGQKQDSVGDTEEMSQPLMHSWLPSTPSKGYMSRPALYRGEWAVVWEKGGGGREVGVGRVGEQAGSDQGHGG